ncbi:beta-ketoacyl synthase N-terminal-like domain-containing protein [Domibacillus sp. DTU_2020_1001157_1_SI_ALB_TIR_016]|uniref:beta-ketoacyl synthase N-terminal-like domain-containing protein n=1 Tax=Domibacillus sp. DTU_2020_1001157_1_SI_ALB_TIR_016 TaxID=3077789 RepID=UPI0028E7DC5E|nr:beta-ketoacyl synthase N-terminal-like domain-containing protein [Domibacillus sp. DTU_2020_1001157_1_SI_ALB_TIR_016]WNS79501.1 beta-ketoacyl synthase N-terminal-like domain-containing protein [Domibacillus sp. DTU_2020_1001157_1_SI_ALB_TIR_016]
MMKVAVTGMGVQLPGADSVSRFAEMLAHNICPLQVVKNIGTQKHRDLVMGVIDHEILSDPCFKRYSRINKLAIAAVKEAFKNIHIENHSGKRISVIFGTSVGGLTEIEELVAAAAQQNLRRYPVTGVAHGNIGSLAMGIGSYIKANHLQLTLGNTCTASTDAILLGKQLLESYITDICVVGGADSLINRTLVYGFLKQRGLAVEEDVRQAGMPFSTSTQGFVVSEGAGALVLEREEDAVRRGADIYAFIEKGFSNHDNISVFQSDQTGENMTEVIQEICGTRLPSYVNSQALGLEENDRVEASAYRNCFDGSVPITSIKGLFGHTFGASGVTQAIASIISIREGFIPATYGTNKKSFESLPVVTEKQEKPVSSVAVTTHGFGGSNTGLLITR